MVYFLCCDSNPAISLHIYIHHLFQEAANMLFFKIVEFLNTPVLEMIRIFDLCLNIKRHKQSFWVPILAAKGPYFIRS